MREFIESREQDVENFAQMHPTHPEVQTMRNLVTAARSYEERTLQPDVVTDSESKESVERPFEVDHFDHMVLHVNDLEKSVHFYELLGGEVALRKAHEGKDYEVSVRVGPQTRVTLTTTPDVHFNFAVNANNDDIDVVAKYFRSNNVPIVEEHEEHTSPTVRVLDPDGNVVEIRLAGVDAAEVYAEKTNSTKVDS